MIVKIFTIFFFIYRKDLFFKTLDEYKQFFLENHNNPTPRYAFYADEAIADELNAACMCSNEIFKEILFTYQTAFGSYIFEFVRYTLEDTLQHIIPAGIPQHSIEYHRWALYGRWEQEIDGGPKVLAMNDLSFGLVLWLGACGVSFLGFCMELLHFKLRKPLRTFIGLVCFLLLINQRLNSCAYL